MDKIVRVNVPANVTLASVFVIWKDANGIEVKEENLTLDSLENYPKHSDAQFDALLKAFAELKEEYNKLGRL